MRSALVAVTAVVVWMSGSVSRAAEKVLLVDLLGDLQKQVINEPHLQLVWWIPSEYWEVALANDKNVPEDARRDILDAFSKHTVLVVADCEFSSLGALKSRSEEDIAEDLSVTLASGKKLNRSAPEDVSFEVVAILNSMKPIIANAVGKVGEGMHFYLYEGVDGDAKRLLDPRKEGGFTVQLGDSKFVWRLPLGSLLPPKYDRKTGEKFPGDYLFSPYTGEELVTRPPR